MASEPSRIETFSDGVFSIAATLLVLELKAPAPTLPFWRGPSRPVAGIAQLSSQLPLRHHHVAAP